MYKHMAKSYLKQDQVTHVDSFLDKEIEKEASHDETKTEICKLAFAVLKGNY